MPRSLGGIIRYGDDWLLPDTLLRCNVRITPHIKA